MSGRDLFWLLVLGCSWGLVVTAATHGNIGLAVLGGILLAVSAFELGVES